MTNNFFFGQMKDAAKEIPAAKFADAKSKRYSFKK